MKVRMIFILIVILTMSACGSLNDETETSMQADANTSGNDIEEKEVISLGNNKESIIEDAKEEEEIEAVKHLNKEYLGTWHLVTRDSEDEYLGVDTDAIIFYNYQLKFGYKFYYKLVEGSDSEIILTALELEGKVLELDNIYRVHFEKDGEKINYTITKNEGELESEYNFEGIEALEIDVANLYSMMYFKLSESPNEVLSHFYDRQLIEKFVYDEPYNDEYGYMFESLLINEDVINFNLLNEEGGIMGDYSSEYLLFKNEDQLLLQPYDELGLGILYKVEKVDEKTLQFTPINTFTNHMNVIESIQYKSDLTLYDHLNLLFGPTKLDSFTEAEQSYFLTNIIGKWVSPYGEDFTRGKILKISKLDMTMAESDTGSSFFARFELTDIDIEKNRVTFHLLKEGHLDEINKVELPSENTLTLQYNPDEKMLLISEYDFGDVNIGWYFGNSKSIYYSKL